VRLWHFMKKESSGLARTTLELCAAEEALGHEVIIQEPQGGLIHGKPTGEADVYIIHSQFEMTRYHDTKAELGIEVSRPVVMVMHGEPLSSVGNGISMKAIIDLAPLCDAFICFRREEQPIWNSIRRTFYVPKGIDLNVFKPLPGIQERLSGNPAVLYYENWRGQRNPLYLVKAMELVWKKYPDTRLHLYNCTDKRMMETFQAYIKHTKSWTYIRSLQGPVRYDEVPLLLNKVDIVVSCLSPLYARGIEAFGCGKAFIGPGYREDSYPWTCELDPQSMAEAIMACHEDYQKVNYREWAESHHDVRESVKAMIEIYARYL
jgi:glycosyltransferase involved in cell wall biosynthesis